VRNEPDAAAQRHAVARDDYESGVGASDRMELRVWLRLITCFNLLDGAVRQRLHHSHATTLPRFDVLAQLYRASAPMTMGDLSRRLMVTNANITGLINRLTREGLVNRKPSREDRRRQMVELTPEGRRQFEAMAEDHRVWITDMTDGLERAEMNELFRLLGRLKESILQSQDNEGTRG
jgi:DNA-binding MarR family transcriptional regulator